MRDSARVWSLWDMFEVYGPDIHEAIVELEQLKSTIADYGKMKQGGSAENIAEANRQWLIKIIDKALPPLTRCNAQLSCLSAQEFRDKLIALDQIVTFTDAWAAFNDINRRFSHELSLVKMYVIYRDKIHLLLKPENLIGEKIMERFPSIASDVTEAAQCLCFGRATASVFHTMRVAEIGVEAFRKHIGAPDPVIVNDRNWGNIIQALKTPIDARWPQKKCFPNTEGSHIRAIFEAIQTIKSSVRDRTMHVERSYSDSQADLVRLNVREFMSQLADRCDENGEPKATDLGLADGTTA